MIMNDIVEKAVKIYFKIPCRLSARGTEENPNEFTRIACLIARV
jgi:hypothetical protein